MRLKTKKINKKLTKNFVFIISVFIIVQLFQIFLLFL